jgi:hypothetical protein
MPLAVPVRSATSLQEGFFNAIIKLCDEQFSPAEPPLVMNRARP